MISEMNVIKSYVKMKSNLICTFILSLCIFYFSSYAMCSDLSFDIRKLYGYSFNKKNFYFSIKNKEIYLIKNGYLFVKKDNVMCRDIKLDYGFDVRGLVFNDNYLIFYGFNNLVILDKLKKSVLWKKTFSEKVVLKPVIYGNSVYLSLDFDKIISFDLFSGSLNWQFKNDVSDFNIYTHAKFMQSRDFLYYICANNKVFVIDKETGLLLTKFDITYRSKLNFESNFRIRCIKLYNSVVYVTYDNGSLLAFDALFGDRLWELKSISCNDFVVHKNFILSISSKGFITLINKFNGKIICRYNNLIGKNLKKIKFLDSNKLIFTFDSKNLFVLKFLNKEVNFLSSIKVKLKNLIFINSSSSFLIFKNNSLKEFVLNK